MMQAKKILCGLMTTGLWCAINLAWAQESKPPEENKPAVSTETTTTEPKTPAKSKTILEWPKDNVWDEFGGELEVNGHGMTGEKQARYLEYRDMPEGFEVNSINVHKKRKTDDKCNFELKVKDAGQDDQNVQFEYQEWESASYKFSLTWDRIPHRYGFGAKTLYTGIGSGTLLLSDSIQTALGSISTAAGPANNTNAAKAAQMLRGYIDQGSHDISDDVMISRDKLTFGFDWYTWDPFRFSIGVEYEEVDGLRPMGASFGFTNTIQLPVTADHTIWGINAAISYATDDVDFGIYYTFNNFTNHDSILVWDNPYRFINATDTTANSTWRAQSFQRGPAQGRMQLEADNYMHRWLVKTGWNLSPNIRFSGEMNWELRKSDPNLLPYTINPIMNNKLGAATFSGRPPFAAYDPANLPDDDFRGEVLVQYYQFALFARPTGDLESTMFMRYYNFNDLRQRFHFPGYVRVDASWQNGEITNTALDYYRWTGGFNAVYHIRDLYSEIKGGYEFNHWHRHNREVPTKREHTFFAKATTDWSPMIKTEVGGELAFQDMTEYHDPPTTEVPWMRTYDENEDDRIKGTAGIKMIPAPDVTAGVNYIYERHNYNAQFGLRDRWHHNITADLNVVPADNLTLTFFWSYDFYNTNQRSREWQSSTTSTAASSNVGNPYNPAFAAIDYPGNWTADVTEHIYTFGFKSSLDIIKEKLIFSTNYIYAWNMTRVHHESEIGTSLTNDLNNYEPMDLRNADNSSRHTINLELTYRLTQHAKFFVGYEGEFYQTANFYDDFVSPIPRDPQNATTSSGAISNTSEKTQQRAYLLGVTFPDYSLHMGYAGFNLSF